MTDEIPQWAKERVCELVNNEHPGWEYTPNEVSISPALRAFARYIAAHEEEPVDPDREEANRIARRVVRSAKSKHSELIAVQAALAAIKRGRELERKP